MVPVAKIADMLGGETILGAAPASLHELRQRVSEGLPKRSVSHVADRVAADPKERRALIHSIVPEATLKRRRDRLSPAESEKTERIARLAALAFSIWGVDDGRTFLANPHPMLNGETPLQAAATELGGREVESILRAIEFGLPA